MISLVCFDYIVSGKGKAFSLRIVYLGCSSWSSMGLFRGMAFGGGK